MFSKRMKEKSKSSAFKAVVELLGSLLVLFLVFGCGGGGGGSNGNGGGATCPQTTVDIAVCNSATGGPFSLTIDNAFFPLVVGTQFVLEGTVDGELVRLVITVLNQTQNVDGVITRVLEERETADGVLVEVSLNYFAQAPDGTVCYFGEDVDIYDETGTNVVSHEGAWHAGVDGAVSGIFMLADPQVGDIYANEFAPGVAEDQTKVTALGDQIVIPAGTFDDTLSTEECNPLAGAEKDTKTFARNIGLVIDGDLELQMVP